MTDIYTPAFFAEHHHTTALSASVVAPLVKDLLEPESVLDIGCGQGEWLEAFGIEDSFGVDIAAPEREGFMRHDLTTELDLDETFDLVISLETAEHLARGSSGYLRRVDCHVTPTKRCCSRPRYQGRRGCTTSTASHTSTGMRSSLPYGFAMTDPIRPLIADDERVSWWYRNNIFVYVR